MSVCQYYLRGNCRYGDRCRYPHVNSNESHMHRQNAPQSHPRPHRAPINPVYKYVAPSVANKRNNVTNPATSATLKWLTENYTDRMKAFDILVQMQTEAKVWLKTGLWRFTSRSLFPGGHPLEHWTDHSFEEMKWAHRCMSNTGEEHKYKKAYSDYWENTQRELIGLSELRIDTIKLLKDHIAEYVASNHKPSTTLPSDIDMKDDNHIITANSSVELTNYTADDQLLADERAAFESDTFELGHIPVHAPSQQFC
ncbi:unnamed protein product [Adineta steineri]|uniref:Nucleoporin NUP42 n=2 Tax=Adineta steineri TaxID=433720 RepID=A0A814DD27_9BILA|nr:unnamed protein product [Adineta steineri]CAF1389671.1 unnamed protein product [Adineta steineri]